MHHDKELQQFLNAHPGFEPDIAWVKRVGDAQKDMRSFLGAETIFFEVEIDDTYTGIPSSETKKIYTYMQKHMPEYLRQYNIRIEEFENPYIERLKKPRHGIKKAKRKINWAKHIKFWCKINEKTPSGIEKIVSDMGEKYAIYANKKIKVVFTISTEPLAYACLGNIGENGSCFRQGSQNPHHKYILGQTPGSFVIFVTHEPFEITYDGITNLDSLGRLWGIRNCKTTQMLLCNWYPKQCKEMNALLPALKTGIKQWLGKDYKLSTDRTIPSVEGVWHNNRGNSNHEINWSLVKKTKPFEYKKTWSCNTANINRDLQVRCESCGRLYHRDDAVRDDIMGSRICYSCIEKQTVKTSDFSGLKSWQASSIYYLDKNNEIKTAFHGEIPDCEEMPLVKGIITSISNNKISYKKFDKTVRDIRNRRVARIIDPKRQSRFVISENVSALNKKVFSVSTEIKETEGILTLER